MREVIGLVVLVACGAAGTPTSAPKPAKAAAPVRPTVRAEVVPGELGDPGVLERIARRVRIHAIGRAWIRSDEGELTPDERAPPIDPVPVLAETRDELRVLNEQLEARVAERTAALAAEILLAADRNLEPYQRTGIAAFVAAERTRMARALAETYTDLDPAFLRFRAQVLGGNDPAG